MATNEKKSTDLIIAAAVLLVLGGGVAWFLLGGESEEAILSEIASPNATPLTAAESIDVEATVGESPTKLLAKARLALNADMLAEPPGQNALYFYSLAVEADPDNAEAQDELANVADQVSAMLKAHVSQKNFAAAAVLAERLVLAAPETQALTDFNKALTAHSEKLLAGAIRTARAGDVATGLEQLRVARELPHADAARLLAAQQEIARISDDAEARVASARKVEQAKEAQVQAGAARSEAEAAPKAEQAVVAKAEAVDPAKSAIAAIRDQIASGELGSENGALALQRSAEKAHPGNAGLSETKGMLIAALQVRAQRQLAFDQLDEVAASIKDIESVEGTESISKELVASLRAAQIRQESTRVISAKELTLVEAVPPVYPRNALRKDKEGWVEVEFTVSTDGRTESIQVVNTSDDSTFNKATIQAVSQWQFEPRNYMGQVIAQRVATRVSFKLTDS